jgi:hypothetical protein
MLLDLDEQQALGIGMGSAGHAAGLAFEDRAPNAAGEADGLGHAGNGADLGELALVDGDEKDAFLTVSVHGKGDVHGWEDDCVIEGNQKKLVHEATNPIRWLSSQQVTNSQEI